MDINSKDIWREPKKYCIICEKESKNSGIEIMNNISLQKKLLDSAGIGLKNVDMMMKHMGGKMEYTVLW